jgi:hypothetical protein
MMMNLTQIPKEHLPPYYHNLLLRGWVWLITEDRADCPAQNYVRAKQAEAH